MHMKRGYGDWDEYMWSDVGCLGLSVRLTYERGRGPKATARSRPSENMIHHV